MDLKALLGRVEREPRCDNHSIHSLSMHACLCLSFSLSPRLRHERDWKSRPCTPFNRAEQGKFVSSLFKSHTALVWISLLKLKTGMVEIEKFSKIEIEINRIEIFRAEIEIGFYRISFSSLFFRFRYIFDNIEKLWFDIFRYKIQLVSFW
jgi:hypothetical protein